jgi:uncharacterized heparinase superfamily protein
MLNAVRYFHTLRYLRPVQIYGRLWYKLYRPKPNLSPPAAVRPPSGTWLAPARKSPALIASQRFRFLNEEHDILAVADWNHVGWAKLWLYNLHYFDDLTAVNASERIDWHRSLIMLWMAENPPGTGNGWEPYPLSLRIVNWIKWALAGNTLPHKALESLAIQTRSLAKRLEFHLLGNHLFANAKALVFAGLFFEGPEAVRWQDTGLRILEHEAPEQILPDGGHFERSPMYHTLVLEDMLDLYNVFNAYQGCVSESIRRSYQDFIERMRRWLSVMCHPDGEISFFNDAAIGVAPSPVEIDAYALRLGLMALDTLADDVTHLAASGHVRVQRGSLVALLDVAPIGPDYLPGHAHADTLSFELSLFEQRMLVNSGTSQYGNDAERQRQRGTAAHNTVTINGQDSSEVWSGFRVARRARPLGLEIREMSAGSVMVRCTHDGYRRLSGNPIHLREWHFMNNSLTIRDVIKGPFTEAVARFHFHPNIAIENRDRYLFSIILPGGEKIFCHVQKGSGRLVPSTYHPEFGLNCQNQCLEVQLIGNESLILFNWS